MLTRTVKSNFYKLLHYSKEELKGLTSIRTIPFPYQLNLKRNILDKKFFVLQKLENVLQVTVLQIESLLCKQDIVYKLIMMMKHCFVFMFCEIIWID